MSMLDWNKDRRRQLGKRAIAEEISEERQAASLISRSVRTVPSKADLRAVGEEAARRHAPHPKGAWVMFCKCGQETKFKLAFSVALDEPLKCPSCGHTSRLTDEHLKPPWE